MPKAKKGPDKTFWMVTFSDLLSLMLTFFVLLLSMSTLSESSLQRIASAVDQGLGIIERGGPFGMWIQPQDVKVTPKMQATYRKEMEVLHRNLSSRLEQMGARARLGTDPQGESLTLSLQAEALFPSAETRLTDRARYVLGEVGEVLRHVPGRLQVVGHSDSVPMGGSGRVSDNWALSLDRAVNVAHYLARDVHLDPNRISVAGYGPSRPVADNATEAGRAANRRITIEIYARQGG
ncbi:OmpA/MotB family protein [Thiohalorhabdus sp.]|uniref:OmpA/MotB family protein n=1 Tax=Thiohalorhabdus sp. TaxID=3094134 RepID=UPI002FC37748